MRDVLRFSRLITVAAAFAVIGCTDATSPEKDAESVAPDVTFTRGVVTTQLQTIGTTLVDATDWVLVAITDNTARLKMKSAIKKLADDLVAGRSADSQADVATLRIMLTNLQQLGPAIGPIGVALDQIDSEFAKSAE